MAFANRVYALVEWLLARFYFVLYLFTSRRVPPVPSPDREPMFHLSATELARRLRERQVVLQYIDVSNVNKSFLIKHRLCENFIPRMHITY